MLKNQAGISKLAVWFWFLLLGIAIYIGVKIVPMYMDAQRMEDTMVTKARVAQVLTDAEIMRDLVGKAKELDLPLTAESFILQRDMDRRKMKIQTAWEVEVHLFGNLYVRTFRFEPQVEENVMSN